MVKARLQALRRKLITLLLGREIVGSLNDVSKLRNKIGDLEYRSESIEHDLVKYMHKDMHEDWLVDRFYKIYGKELDFNNLNTFNEKMQWIKIYGADELQTLLADKYLVKDYIAKHIGDRYVVPLLGVFDKFEEIDFNSLPDRFVIKTNNASKSNAIVTDKTQVDLDLLKSKIEHWLSRSQFTYGLEMHYKDIKPKIIVEEYLELSGGVEDYKFYCFGGEPKYLLVIGDRFGEEKMGFYDMDFNKKDISILPGMKDLSIDKPEQFDEMLKQTRRLLSLIDYPFVRIDWYLDSKGNIYFGEFTFTPGAGWYFFDPESQNEEWGDMIDLSKKDLDDARLKKSIIR